MTQIEAQHEAQALANDHGCRYIVFSNRQDKEPNYEVCASNEAPWWLGPHYYIVSRHCPA